MKQLLLATLAAAFLSGTPTFAQSKGQLVEECLAAIESGDISKAEQIVEEIKTWRQIWATKLILDARDCLDGVTDKKWFYSNVLGKFTSVVDQTEAEKQRREAEYAERQKQEEDRRIQAALLPRKCALRAEVLDLEESIERLDSTVWFLQRTREVQVAEETVTQCKEWFAEDKMGALTNDICNRIFTEIGLPDSEYHEQLAKAESEVREERSRLSDLKKDLKIIEENDMLPEEYREQQGLSVEETSELLFKKILRQQRENSRRDALGVECLQ